MAGTPGDSSREAALQDMREKAVKLWGPERASLLEPSLKHMADYLGQLDENLPDREEEPAFFL